MVLVVVVVGAEVVVAERMALGRVRRPDFYENLLGGLIDLLSAYTFLSNSNW